MLSMGLKGQCQLLKKGNACLQPLMGADIIIGRQTASNLRFRSPLQNAIKWLNNQITIDQVEMC